MVVIGFIVSTVGKEHRKSEMVIVFEAYLIQYPEVAYHRDMGQNPFPISEEPGFCFRSLFMLQVKDDHVLDGF